MPYTEVVFNLPLNHAYTYKIPHEIENVKTGMRVLVPFGKRTITGIVVRLSDKSNYSSVKNIIDVLDKEPLISEDMFELTKWISEYYFSSWGQALQLTLPKGIDSQEKEIIHLIEENATIELPERQRELYLMIGADPDNSKDFYRKKYGSGNFYYLLNRLEEKGLIYREKELRNARVRALYRKYVAISETYSSDKENHPGFLKYIKRRPEVDEYLVKNSASEILMTDFLKQTKMASATLQKMATLGLCRIFDQKIERRPEFDYHEEAKDITLTDEQVKVVKTVLTQLDKGTFSTYLLHGVTGSGKTQVYIEILKEVLKKGKTAIILIPEISLTPQTVHRFQSLSEEEIAVFHSKMSQGERFDAWTGCFKGRVKIVVGPRSALFAPLKSVGLIVVDEEHENTYKQSDTSPRYHARDVAIYWARQNNSLVVLGSATPSLESYYNARRGKYELLEILNRVDNIRMPDVYIVDMKRNRVRIDSQVTLFSQVLLDKINERLERNEQIIIMQNRRGFSSFMQCKECGFIPVCPNCDISLTYHSFNEKLQCHLCGHLQPAYNDCPACGDKQIVYKGVGTQRIESELAQLLPDVRVLRMDQDTTRGKNRHDVILKAFGAGEADILLGTQMIAKGLDFSNVTLVGVVSADVGLALPDFRAPERVFQLLTQVAGRSGRGSKFGEVVVQTYQSSHYSVQFAQAHDFTGFYMQEMQHRRDYRYPPFFKIIQILVQAADLSAAISTARIIAINVKRRVSGYGQVIGPAPAIITRMNNLYRWQLNIKLNASTDPSGRHTKEILRQVLEPFLGRGNKDVRVIVDVDPLVLN